MANSFAVYEGADYPIVAYVLETIEYGDPINVLVGTLDPGDTGGGVIPAIEDVREGVAVGIGETGVLELPPESQVLVGIGFGANGTEFEGTLSVYGYYPIR